MLSDLPLRVARIIAGLVEAEGFGINRGGDLDPAGFYFRELGFDVLASFGDGRQFLGDEFLRFGKLGRGLRMSGLPAFKLLHELQPDPAGILFATNLTALAEEVKRRGLFLFDIWG